MPYTASSWALAVAQELPGSSFHLCPISFSKAAAGKMNLYESFAQATQLGDLHTCLMMDMKACQEDDVRLLCYLTPSIYTEVRQPARGPRLGEEGISSPCCGQLWAKRASPPLAVGSFG